MMMMICEIWPRLMRKFSEPSASLVSWAGTQFTVVHERIYERREQMWSIYHEQYSEGL